MRQVAAFRNKRERGGTHAREILSLDLLNRRLSLNYSFIFCEALGMEDL